MRIPPTLVLAAIVPSAPGHAPAAAAGGPGATAVGQLEQPGAPPTQASPATVGPAPAAADAPVDAAAEPAAAGTTHAREAGDAGTAATGSQGAPEPAAPAGRPRPTVLTESRGLPIGTVRVAVPSLDEPSARAALEAAFGEVGRVDALLSERRPGSETSRLDAAAGGPPLAVSPELVALVARGRELSALTGGAFALTAGALGVLWPFDAPPSLREPPAAARLAEARASVGDDRIAVDAGTGTIQLPAGARLELRAVLRGYALSRALAVVAGAGVRDVLVSVAGAVAARGTKAGAPWIVGIQDPRGAGHFAILPVRDEAVVTRGDHERFFVVGGRRFHDVLDPRTGEPANGCRSVTIVAADPVLADALSTAVMVLGPRPGMALVERTADAGAVIVTATGEVVVSPGLEGRLRVLRAPGS